MVASIRSGAWSAELENHVSACAICTDTKRVMQLCLDHATTMSVQSPPPPAHIVWQQIEVQKRHLALARATRCIAWMRLLAGLYAVVLTAWFLPQLWHLRGAPLSTSLSTLSGGTVFAGILAATVAVVLGSCCLVLLGSNADPGMRT